MRTALLPLFAAVMGSCAVAMPLAHAATAPSIATQPISRMSTPWWKERFDTKQAEIASGKFDLVWLGDSITQNWEKSGGHGWDDYKPVWEQFYGRRHALNLGFKGDSTCHVLWRLEHGELDFAHAPRVIVMLIGANNFGHIHTDAEQTFDGLVRIVDLIHQRLPTTRLVVLGTLPSIRNPWVDQNTALLNARLAREIGNGRPWLAYVDAGSAVMTAGRPDRDHFADSHLVPPEPPLHPDAQSQARIAHIIEPIIAHDLDERAD